MLVRESILAVLACFTLGAASLLAQPRSGQTVLSTAQTTTNPTSTQPDEDAWEAVMKFLIPIYRKTGPTELVFASVGKRDPADRLLARLKKVDSKVKRLSECEERELKISEKATGKPGFVLELGNIQWASTNAGTLWAAYHLARVGGSVRGVLNLQVTREGSEWKVAPQLIGKNRSFEAP